MQGQTPRSAPQASPKAERAETQGHEGTRGLRLRVVFWSYSFGFRDDGLGLRCLSLVCFVCFWRGVRVYGFRGFGTMDEGLFDYSMSFWGRGLDSWHVMWCGVVGFQSCRLQVPCTRRDFIKKAERKESNGAGLRGGPYGIQLRSSTTSRNKASLQELDYQLKTI